MAAFAGIIVLIGLIAAIAGLALFLPLNRLRGHRVLRWPLVAGGLAAFIVGAVLMPPPTVAHQPAATAVSRPIIRVTGDYPPILNIDLDFGDARSGGVIAAAGDEVAVLATDLDRRRGLFARQRYDAINFTVFGGKGAAAGVGRKLIHFSIRTDTLRRLVKTGATSTTMLNAATEAGSWTPANDDVVREYCLADTKLCRMIG